MSREYSLSAPLCTLQTAERETIRARQHPASPTGPYKSRGVLYRRWGFLPASLETCGSRKLIVIDPVDFFDDLHQAARLGYSLHSKDPAS
jgi:hypothetical protein